MKTVRTIPWEAVVNAKPRARACSSSSSLLTVARSFARRSDVASDATLLDTIVDAFATNPVAIVSRSGPSALVELALPDGTIVVLTGGPKNPVLQLRYVPQTSRHDSSPELRRDALLRTHVLRHARLDPDDRMFVTARENTRENTEPDMRRSPQFQFLHPENWGFVRSERGYHWTAANLFKYSKSHRQSPLTRPRYQDPFEDPTAAPPPDRGDPSHCLPQLRQALSTGNCLDLAIALGRCRLFGVTTTGNDDFTLSTHAAAQAMSELRAYMETLSTDFDRAAPHRAQTLALELLEARMDLWAAYIALDEAYAAARYDANDDAADHTANVIGLMLQSLGRGIERFDANLENQSSRLTPAAATFLLDNWRRLLAPAYREVLPWWLDGSLEANVK
jgi:hypothetical protein